jgi:HemY protein
MIRLLIILISAGLIATGIARLIDMPGGFDFVVGSYEIHASVPAAVGLLVFTVILLFLLTRLAFALVTAPHRVRSWVRDRRARRGFQALSRGLVAARAGDQLEARRFARRGEMLLGNAPLGLLLVADAAQLEGNEEKQASTFRTMLNYPETEILGLRGLFLQAMRKGDEEEALRLAERAFDLRTRTQWAAQALFDLHASRHEWDHAQGVLKKQLRSKLISPDVARRRRAVALTAAGIDADRAGDNEAALERGLEAVTMAPALIPAAVLTARKLTQAGRVWKAQDVIETAWSQSPHPDLASAYAAVHPTHDALTRARRMENLVKLNPGHVESRILVAEQAMALGQWHDARAALEPLMQGTPTARACVMMAEIAQQERGDMTAAQGWLARASRAPRDAQWRCARCSFVVHEWTATCNNCGAFDTLSWSSPQVESTPAQSAPMTSLPPAYAPPRSEARETAPLAPVIAARPREDRTVLSRPPDDPGADAAAIFDEAEEEFADDPFAAEDAIGETPEGPLRRRSQ